MVLIRDLETLRILSSILSALVIGYSTWFYYQYFSVYGYRKISLIVRSFATAISLYIVFVIAMVIYGVTIVVNAKG